MTHTPASCDLFHDPLDDCSYSRLITPMLTEVLDILEVPHPGTRVRLSVHDWRRVDAVCAALADARTRPAVPEPQVLPDVAGSPGTPGAGYRAGP